MTAQEVKRALSQAGILIGRKGDKLTLDAVLTDAIPPALMELAREHKRELLELLDFEQRADALLMASTRRIAAGWHVNAPELEGEEWTALEEMLAAAYRAQDLNVVITIIMQRERHALRVIGEVEHE